MLSLPASVRVWVALDPVDMRKSFNGLFAVATEQLQEDPRRGDLFLFTNRNRNRLKLLYWDGNGLWVFVKRLERGTFSWPGGTAGNQSKLQLTREAMLLLVNGVDLKQGSLRPWYER